MGLLDSHVPLTPYQKTAIPYEEQPEGPRKTAAR